MRSTGNDIVALRKVDKERTGQFRFYSKILSVSEQELYQHMRSNEMPFEHFVWLLWSIKESAYKFLKRNNPGLVFSPTKTIIQNVMIPDERGIKKKENIDWEYNCGLESLYNGKVIYGNDMLYFRSKYSEDWITTVVNDENNFANICWAVRFIKDCSNEHQSGLARTLLIAKLKHTLPGDYRVEKHAVGYPVILDGTLDIGIPVSLAHDGHFVGYSFRSS